MTFPAHLKLSAAVLAVACTAGIFQAHHNAQLRDQNRLLQQQRASTLEQLQILQRERDEANSRFALLTKRQSASNAPESDQQFRQLLRLRGMVGLLKRQLAEANHQALPAGSALDLVQAGEDIFWQDDSILRVTKRDGLSLKGIQIVRPSPEGKLMTLTADTGTISLGSIEDPSDTNSVKVTLHDAYGETAAQTSKTTFTATEMTFVLKK